MPTLLHGAYKHLIGQWPLEMLLVDCTPQNKSATCKVKCSNNSKFFIDHDSFTRDVNKALMTGAKTNKRQSRTFEQADRTTVNVPSPKQKQFINTQSQPITSSRQHTFLKGD